MNSWTICRYICRKNKGDKEISKSNFYFDRKGLYLKKSVLKAGWEYGIYVTYPGGSTGVYTFVYGEELISNEHWYKRNYADRMAKSFRILTMKRSG